MKTSRFDWEIFLSLISLSSLGLLTLFSIEPSLFQSQLIFFFLGLVFFIFFRFIDPDILFNFKNLFYLVLVGSLILTFFLGENIRGSARWINFGPFSLQFSEIMKPFFIIFLAVLLNQDLSKYYKLLRVIIFSLPPLFMIFKQPDLGNTIVYIFIIIGMLLLNRYYLTLIISCVSSLFFLPVIWRFLAVYQQQRIITFLNPNLDPQGAGYNALQSAIAVGSGGLWGKGLGKGTQSHLDFLPERHTDFIFASFAEEFGFVGAFILICLFIFLLYRILKIASNSSNPLEVNFCIGVLTLLACQFFINIGMNIGILPITGITLPLISYGGSSLLSTMISLGIVEAIANKEQREDRILIK